MAKPNAIELPGCEPIPILYEDRSVLAIDKPRGWMLVPHSWRKTNWNLQAAIDSSIRADEFWARSRNLTYLRHIHRLDADTSGVMRCSPGVKAPCARWAKCLNHAVWKKPTWPWWKENRLKRNGPAPCPSGPIPKTFGRMRVDMTEEGKESETHFRVLQSNERFTLIEAKPKTGRTHQIRVHLAESGSPIMCDELYGRVEKGYRLGLRAVRLAYRDTFTRRPVDILAPTGWFLREFGFPGMDKSKPERPAPKPAPKEVDASPKTAKIPPER